LRDFRIKTTRTTKVHGRTRRELNQERGKFMRGFPWARIPDLSLAAAEHKTRVRGRGRPDEKWEGGRKTQGKGTVHCARENHENV